MKKLTIQSIAVVLNNKEKINIICLESKNEKYVIYSSLNLDEGDIDLNIFSKMEFKEDIQVTPKKKFNDSNLNIANNKITYRNNDVYYLKNDKSIIINNKLRPILLGGVLYEDKANNDLVNSILSKKSTAPTTSVTPPPSSDVKIIELFNKESNSLLSKEEIENTEMKKVELAKENNSNIQEDSEIKIIQLSSNSIPYEESKIVEIPKENNSIINNIEEASDIKIIQISNNALQQEAKTIDIPDDIHNIIKDNAESKNIEISNVNVDANTNVDSNTNVKETLVHDKEEKVEEKNMKIEKLTPVNLKQKEESVEISKIIDTPSDVNLEVKKEIKEEEITKIRSIDLKQEEVSKDVVKKEEIQKLTPVNINTLQKHPDVKSVDKLEVKKIEIPKEVMKPIEIIKESIVNVNQKVDDVVKDIIEFKETKNEVLKNEVLKSETVAKNNDKSDINNEMFNLQHILSDFNKLFQSIGNDKDTNIIKNVANVIKNNNEEPITITNKVTTPVKSKIPTNYVVQFNYQNVNYKVNTLRLKESNNLNLSNLFTTKISEENIVDKYNLAFEIDKNNSSYLISFLNQKYLINKINNSIVVTNLLNRNSQIIKNKEYFKMANYDFILYNDCSLIIPMINKRIFDNNYGTAYNLYTPRI